MQKWALVIKEIKIVTQTHISGSRVVIWKLLFLDLLCSSESPQSLDHQLPAVGNLLPGSPQSSLQKLGRNAGPMSPGPPALLSPSPSEWPWRLVAFLMVITLVGGC